MSYVRLCGYVIKVDPLAVLALNNTLCAQNHAVRVILGECLENSVNALCGELLGGLAAKAGEDLVSVVMAVIMTAA